MINDLIVVVQTSLAVYVLYLLIKNNESRKYIYTYLIISIYFILLKFEIIKFEEGTVLNHIVWWIYNSLLYAFIIYYINSKNGKTNNNSFN